MSRQNVLSTVFSSLEVYMVILRLVQWTKRKKFNEGAVQVKICFLCEIFSAAVTNAKLGFDTVT